MTLSEKMNLLNSLINDLRRDTALALTVQGVYTEFDNLHLKDIPDLIAKIRVYDFNYKFDFKALESVGVIHSRAEGVSTGGMSIDPQPFVLKSIIRFDMNTETPITYCYSGVYGQNSSITTNCTFPNISHYKIKFDTLDQISI
jgi:hypothetical protein